MTAARLAAVRAVLDRWERTAQDATPGEWRVNNKERTVRAVGDGYEDADGNPWGGTILHDVSSYPDDDMSDAEHIATFDPPAVLALVGYLRRQAVGVEWLLRDPGTPTALNAALSNLAALESAVGIDHVTTTEESP